MAQSIVLKRSALSGKVPDTSSLSLGEIALFTDDVPRDASQLQ
jgi:hypothetical protein